MTRNTWIGANKEKWGTFEIEAMGGWQGNLDEVRVLQVAISGEIVDDGDFPIRNGINFGLFWPNLGSLRTPIWSLVPFLGYQKLCTSPGISHCHVHPTLVQPRQKTKKKRNSFRPWRRDPIAIYMYRCSRYINIYRRLERRKRKKGTKA